MRRLLTLCALAVLPALFAPQSASAQLTTSLGVGIAQPTGDFADVYDRGFTVRAQAGLSLLLASVHAQVGITRFPGETVDDTGSDIIVDISDTSIYQAGVGARFGAGLFWFGANASYYFGDDVENEIGIAPEVGVSFLMLEAVADYRITGDAKFAGVRLALKF